ncbi:MAG: hypothetical protein V3S64_03005 [bacterium]
MTGAWLALLLTGFPVVLLPVFLSAVLVLGGCSVQREVLSEDRKNRFKAVLLTGTPEPESAPSPKFNQLSEGQVGRSLRRMTVRVSKFISFNRGDPTPFHTDAQIDWAKKVMVEWIPKLNPDQRLQLHYLDQFHKYLVEVEIWAEGNRLVYYFTKLSAKDESPDRDTAGERPANWVTLVEQPGQSLTFDDRAYILKDLLFSVGEKTVRNRKEKFDAIQAALAKQIIDANESRELSRLVDEAPRVSLVDFKTYLDKRETLKKALSQNLLTLEEFETRRDRLKKTMSK